MKWYKKCGGSDRGQSRLSIVQGLLLITGTLANRIQERPPARPRSIHRMTDPIRCCKRVQRHNLPESASDHYPRIFYGSTFRCIFPGRTHSPIRNAVDREANGQRHCKIRMRLWASTGPVSEASVDVTYPSGWPRPAARGVCARSGKTPKHCPDIGPDQTHGVISLRGVSPGIS